jgi:hypothetical protein
VVAVSLAGRRWGPTAAGVLGGFPVVAGPILLVVTLVHGRDFGADAAAGSLLGLAAVAACVVVYARLAPSASPALTLIASWAAFFAGVALLGWIRPPLVAAFTLAAACFEAGRLLIKVPPGAAAAVPLPPWWDLPARALAAMALVLAVTIPSDALGATLSGQLASFPVLTSVLIVFTHLTSGATEVQVLSRAFLLGFYGFAVFSLVLATTLPDLGTAPSFLLATAVAMVVQLAIGRRARGGGATPTRYQRARPLAG